MPAQAQEDSYEIAGRVTSHSGDTLDPALYEKLVCFFVYVLD